MTESYAQKYVEFVSEALALTGEGKHDAAHHADAELLFSALANQ